jgi:hypothetical protein
MADDYTKNRLFCKKQKDGTEGKKQKGEVTTGYVMLGGLISIFANKLTRRC